jgi:ABC-type transporter Mla subunit MlaD
MEVSGKYAPIRRSMHAIIRQKTLLGETYVQLIPEGNRGPYLADGSQLPNGQIEPSVTLDDILAAFDPTTRRYFQIWMQSAAEGINGRGEQINADFAQLEPFVEHGNRLLTVLNQQEGAVRALVHNTGVVFNALASRDHQLEGLIVNGERTFHAAAEGSQAWAAAFQALPTFERNSTVALKEIDAFAVDAVPFLDRFRNTEVQLSALLSAAKPFAPELNGFLTSLEPLTRDAAVGLPDVKKSLDLTVPVLESLRPVLHNLDPFLQYTGEYLPEVQSFFANLTAASQFHGNNNNTPGGPAQHLLTSMNTLGPGSLALYPSKVGTARTNPYFHSGAFRSLLSGLPVFEANTCANSAPAVNPKGPTNETVNEEILQLMVRFRVANEPNQPNKVPAPPCVQQPPQTFNGRTSQFPHVTFGGK